MIKGVGLETLEVKNYTETQNKNRAVLSKEINIQYIGGPTALLEVAGLRFLTDPTFDPKGSEYKTSIYTLRKLADPVIDAHDIGDIDYILLSHDHHFDNLDNEGRHLLAKADTVFTTMAGAERLGGNAAGLANWQTVEIAAKDGRIITITGTPCRHGPVNGDRGPVTGFVLQFKGERTGAVYITGDTVWYEGVEEVGKRFDIGTVVLFLGAAVVPQVGADHLTMTVEEGVKAAQYFSEAQIVPLHFEGWQHFTESHDAIESAFTKAGLLQRLKW